MCRDLVYVLLTPQARMLCLKYMLVPSGHSTTMPITYLGLPITQAGNLLQPPLPLRAMIMIMIEIQYSGTLLLLLCILHQNNHTSPPNYIFIVWKEDASLPAILNLLCSSMNQQLFKKNFCNQSSHYGSHHVPTTKLTLFVVSKDEWDKKEDTMKNALHVQ